jgi:hypothetical protein
MKNTIKNIFILFLDSSPIFLTACRPEVLASVGAKMPRSLPPPPPRDWEEDEGEEEEGTHVWGPAHTVELTLETDAGVESVGDIFTKERWHSHLSISVAFLISMRLFDEITYKVPIYIQSTTVFVPSLELGLSHPFSRQRVCSSPPPVRKGGEAYSPAGEGLWQSQFRRLEKKLSTLPTLWNYP